MNYSSIRFEPSSRSLPKNGFRFKNFENFKRMKKVLDGHSRVYEHCAAVYSTTVFRNAFVGIFFFHCQSNFGHVNQPSELNEPENVPELFPFRMPVCTKLLPTCGYFGYHWPCTACSLWASRCAQQEIIRLTRLQRISAT